MYYKFVQISCTPETLYTIYTNEARTRGFFLTSDLCREISRVYNYFYASHFAKDITYVYV